MTNSPYSLGFGSGFVYGIDQTAAHPTPIQYGVIQSASVDFKATTTKLYGQYKLPVAAGSAKIEVAGKVKFANYTGRIFKEFFGASMTGGQILAANAEAGAIPASSAYTVTVTNSATFTTDLGVTYASTGIPLVNVASGPATGQYSYAAGVYTFAAGDASANVFISYLYTASSSGDVITVTNQAQGAASLFKAVLDTQYQGNQVNFTLNACIYTSLKGLDTKIGEFTMPELDFDAIVDSSGTLGTISVPLVS